MKYREQGIEWEKAVRADDFAAARQVLVDHPELLADPENAVYMLYCAARDVKLPALITLVELGIDVNLPLSEFRADRALWWAALAWYRDPSRAVEMVRWLVAHGARVNFGFKDEPLYPYPLMQAIKNNVLEMVEAMASTGEGLNLLGKYNRTALSEAIECGRDEIAAYLRSKGAKESHEVPGYVPPPPRDPDLAHVEDEFGEVHPFGWQPVIPDEPAVAVRACLGADPPFLFTQGMSAKPLTVPPGDEGYQYAELCLPLGPDWDEDPDAWQEPEYRWAIDWLRNLALYPHQHGDWLGGRYCVVSNGDRPDPLSPYTPMTCWLLLAEKGPLTRFTAADGREVVYYTALPLHTAERDFERRHGLPALLERFADRDAPEYLAPDRPSVV